MLSLTTTKKKKQNSNNTYNNDLTKSMTIIDAPSLALSMTGNLKNNKVKSKPAPIQLSNTNH